MDALALERSECQRLAPKYRAQAEVRLWDGSRVDLLNDQFAIEVDWSHKWQEAIGQALYYAMVTGKKPAVLLLAKPDRKLIHLYRCFLVCQKHGIEFYQEDSE